MKFYVGKKWLIGIVIVFTLIIMLGGFIGNYFYNFALNNHIDRVGAARIEKAAAREASDLLQWLKQTGGYTTEYITSFDGLRLQAYEIKNKQPSNKWVILCHGYGESGETMATQAKKFYSLGFNILVPDARGHGLSDGHYIGMGWNERRDVVNWSQKIVDQDQQAQIALYGVSMGAATVMMASGEADLPKQVRVVIEDCGYSSIVNELRYQLKAQFHLPAFPILNFSSFVTRLRAGYWLGEGNVLKQLSQSTTPTLFIHGAADDYVPTAMVEDVYNAANVPKEKVLIADAAHARSLQQDPTLYWQKIEAFMFKYIDR